VKASMTTMARAGGRYLGGRPPYGYQLAPVSAHPNSEKARVGATLNRLEPDPATAPIIRRIFTERLAGAGYSAIARGLNVDSIPSPSSSGSGSEPASRSARLVRQRSARHSDECSLHGPRSMESPTSRLRAPRPDRARRRARSAHALEQHGRVDLVPRTHPRGVDYSNRVGASAEPDDQSAACSTDDRRHLPAPGARVLLGLRAADDRTDTEPATPLLPLRTA
jgi:hypothetical protein